MYRERATKLTAGAHPKTRYTPLSCFVKERVTKEMAYTSRIQIGACE